MARPKIYDDSLRDQLISRADQLLTEGGVEALSVRALSAAEGTSTNAVYSLFGGKSGIVNAVVARASASFYAAQCAVVDGTDVAADILALGTAYWNWALDNPTHYAVMFGGLLSGFELDPQTEQSCAATIEPLAGAVHRGKVQKLWRRGTEETITMSLWASVHGLVGLAQLGPDQMSRKDWEKILRPHLLAIYRGWLAPPR
ncbi:TetR family transcriptional regulator [Antricoccus suffuscus]|uniref:TetR family transcriptional regulator n=1 Tax=Antricoccus suffuscus TaxID=1629062 RepID=A0A2T0ZXH5_9ACTN|nr:TetR-like C-terminal domain-containing protein [Antricoccus suffuscus]PRZ41050.1 TetR family transcriptional regulator [Antricoccus suffuscus]